eukprot:4881534-Pyramimonas_sp.AAC.1
MVSGRIARVATLSNVCILCGNMYSTARVASDQMLRSLANKKCSRSRGSAMVLWTTWSRPPTWPRRARCRS